MIQQLIDFLESHELRPLDEEFLRDLWPTIMEVVRNPTSNRPAAAMLLLIAVLFVVIVWMALIQVISRTYGDEEDDYEYILVDEDVDEIAAVQAAVPTISQSVPRDALRYHRAVLWGVGSFMLVLIAAGVGSQAREVCLSCHADTKHTAAVASDAHRSVRCTGCHESGNALTSLTLAVPARMVHIFSGFFAEEGRGGYGPVAGSACMGCHQSVTSEVVEVPGRALRISHVEPLEAGAGCMHCHLLDEQSKLGRKTVGMSACLRCHNDADASADCSECHTGDVSLAVVSTLEHEPRQIIAQPDCYTCHQPASCDTCHGVRLPHPLDYRWTHMMDAARDIWFNEGATCFSCHTAERNSCYQLGCHANDLDFHRGEDPTFPRTHGSDPDWRCDSCHVYAASLDDPCAMCHEHDGAR